MLEGGGKEWDNKKRDRFASKESRVRCEREMY